jgi:HEAT repeat protein
MDERAGEGTSTTEPNRKTSWLQVVAAVAVCGLALYWAYGTAREGMNPVLRSARMLRSGDADDRRIAARTLGSSEREEIEVALPALIAAMKDGSPEVRAEVALALGNLSITAIRIGGFEARVGEAARSLVAALGDGSAEVRVSAAIALGQCAGQNWGDSPPFDAVSAITALTGLLADDSESVRSNAEATLAQIAIRAPVGPPAALIEGLKDWPLKQSRKSAAVALGSFKRDLGPAVAGLTRALGDKEPEVRSNAAVALGSIGLEAVPALPALAKNVGDPYVPAPVPNELVLLAAVGAGGPGDGPPPPVPTDPALQAVQAIGRIAATQVQESGGPPAEAVEALTRALDADRPALKAAAEEALRRIGKRAAAVVPTLTRALADSNARPGSSPMAARLLGFVAPGSDRAGEAITALTSALDSADRETSMAAVASLGRFGKNASAALAKLQTLGQAKGLDAESARVIKIATDRVEGKVPADPARQKGQRRRSR